MFSQFFSCLYSVMGNYFMSLLIKRIATWLWFEMKEIPEFSFLKWNIIKHTPVVWILHYLAALVLLLSFTPDNENQGSKAFLITRPWMTSITLLLLRSFRFFLLHPFTLVELRAKEECITFLREIFVWNSSQLFWRIRQRKLSFISVLGNLCTEVSRCSVVTESKVTSSKVLFIVCPLFHRKVKM